MSRIADILDSAPWGVWPLLALLLFLGILGLRTRPVPVLGLLPFPLAFFGLSVFNLLPLDALAPLRIAVWVAALLAGVVPGWLTVRVREVAVDRARGRIVLPGSVVPLALMIGSFIGSYYFGYMFVRHPELKSDVSMLVQASAFRGLISGYFLGQMLRYFRLYFRAPPSATPA